MPNQLGPLEFCCDAPPYNIVRACRMIGLRSPEDVRWCRLSPFIGTSPKPQSWRMLLGMTRPEEGACTCGQKLPLLERYTFTLISGNQSSYFLGQCSRCRSIYWDQG